MFLHPNYKSTNTFKLIKKRYEEKNDFLLNLN